jgi:hypothetical protein
MELDGDDVESKPFESAVVCAPPPPPPPFSVTTLVTPPNQVFESSDVVFEADEASLEDLFEVVLLGPEFSLLVVAWADPVLWAPAPEITPV